MQSHEYRVIPAPRRGVKVKGARTPEDRFARAIEGEMNRMALEGWEFVRSDTLPCEQKSGWFSKPVTVFQTMLVFRRPKAEEVAEPGPAAVPSRLHVPLASASAAEHMPAPVVAATPAAQHATFHPALDAPATPPTLALVEPDQQDRPAEPPRHAAE